jgi:hypothetical protein
MALIDVLRARGCLLEGEEAMLLAPDARALPPEMQLKYLRDNRSVGRFVTGFAGGVRLLFLGGGVLGLVLTMCDGETPVAWWSVLIALVLAAGLVWLTPQFLRRMRELARPLPAWSEIEAELRRERA